MKKLILGLVAVALVFPFNGVQARSASNQGKHLKNNPAYDCSVTKKPSTPKWVDQRRKKEKVGNGKIELIWEDADRAHDVEIKWNGGTKKTGDDGDWTFKNLKNGKTYSFKVRGVSNCGKSGWTKTYNFIP